MFLHTNLNFKWLVYPLLSFIECMFPFKTQEEWRRPNLVSEGQVEVEDESQDFIFLFWTGGKDAGVWCISVAVVSDLCLWCLDQSGEAGSVMQGKYPNGLAGFVHGLEWVVWGSSIG